MIKGTSISRNSEMLDLPLLNGQDYWSGFLYEGRSIIR